MKNSDNIEPQKTRVPHLYKVECESIAEAESACNRLKNAAKRENIKVNTMVADVYIHQRGNIVYIAETTDARSHIPNAGALPIKFSDMMEKARRK